MEKQSFFFLKTLLVLIVISESAVIVPRSKQNEERRGIPRRTSALEKDRKWEASPGMRNPEKGGDDFSSVEYDTGVNNPPGQPSDYDYVRPEDNDKSQPGIKPAIIPEVAEGTNNKEDKPSKSRDEENFEPFDEEEDSDKAIGVDDEESKPSADEDDQKVHEEEGDGEKVEPEEDGDEDKDPDDKHDEKPSDEHDENPNDEQDQKPSDEHDVNDKEPDYHYGHKHHKHDSSYFGGSFFDTPFFNLNKIRKYFNQMERALEQVFHQTLEEARLLNGTYANTTEEEVEIGGRKYVVQKSIIKGADNRSSIYVETMSTKPKMDNNMKSIKDTVMRKRNKEKED